MTLKNALATPRRANISDAKRLLEFNEDLQDAIKDSILS